MMEDKAITNMSDLGKRMYAREIIFVETPLDGWSKIVHAGQNFETEKLFAEVDDAVKSKERLQMAEVVVLSKLAIIMWTIKTSEFYKARFK
jgi:hypothetical protein